MANVNRVVLEGVVGAISIGLRYFTSNGGSCSVRLNRNSRYVGDACELVARV